MHVAELVRALRDRGDIDVQVRCFGAPRDEAGHDGVRRPAGARGGNAALQTLGVDVSMAGDCVGADLVHSHTWYANMAGHLASLLGGMPHVVTAHSLEPMRPWKAEQLGGGYRVSSWAERTAYEAAAAVIAVSAGMREDILKSYPSLDPARVHVVHNGIDSQLWSADRSAEATEIVRRHGVDPDKRVGRLRRPHHPPEGPALPAAGRAQLPPDVQLVLCAGAPDTPEILAEVEGLMNELRVAARGRRLDPRHAAARRGRRPAQPRHRLRLPVGLRAARHRQPRGDGVRARRRRHRDRRHPRGRRRRRDRVARADRAGPGRHRDARRPGPLRRRPRCRADRRGVRRRPRPRLRSCRSRAGCRLVLVGLDRRPHARGLPGGPRRRAPGGAPREPVSRRGVR